MKRSKRYIKKQSKRPLIDKRALQYIIRDSFLVQHAIKELKLAGYGKGEGGPNDWIYEQVLEAVAVFASHDNSRNSAPFEINLVQKLCNLNVISPLRFTDDEWNQINFDGTYQNKRKLDVFKESNGRIYYDDAFTNRAIRRYSYDTEEWTDNKNPLCWSGGLFEHSNGILTGRYFNRCFLYFYDINEGWMPKETKVLDCVEVEIAPDNWIMAVQDDSIDLLTLSCSYIIDWKECPCMKDIRLEDVTPALEEKAFKEIRNNE